MPRRSNTREESDDEEEPKMDSKFPKVIIVDGLPVVPSEKHEKLSKVIQKFFTQVGTIVELDMPKDDKGTSLG